ncbi:hypothetical protein [Pararhodobacter marinus]
MTSSPQSPTRPSFLAAWLAAGLLAACLVLVSLPLFAILVGQPAWAPINATTHIIQGPEAALAGGFDAARTGLGAAINAAACFFWAAVATLGAGLLSRGRTGTARGWIAGFGTAALAGVVDYVLLPAALRPGWEHSLPALWVAMGFVMLGLGLSLGLSLGLRGDVSARHRGSAQPEPAATVPPPAQSPAQPVIDTRLDAMRHPEPGVIDERQSRIDPAGRVTEDPNDPMGATTKQPGRIGDEAETGRDTPEVRVAGRKQMSNPPRHWTPTDEESDESFPASDPPANY